MGDNMIKRLLFVFFSFIVLLSCKNHNISKSYLIGSWDWTNSTTNTVNGEVVLTDFGQTMGSLPYGVVISKLVFNADMTVKNIIEAKDKTQEIMMETKGINPLFNTGKWDISRDTIKIEWQTVQIQKTRIILISDTLYFIYSNINSIVKYVKESQNSLK